MRLIDGGVARLDKFTPCTTRTTTVQERHSSCCSAGDVMLRCVSLGLHNTFLGCTLCCKLFGRAALLLRHTLATVYLEVVQ